jgi:hypothetical protein
MVLNSCLYPARIPCIHLDLSAGKRRWICSCAEKRSPQLHGRIQARSETLYLVQRGSFVCPAISNNNGHGRVSLLQFLVSITCNSCPYVKKLMTPRSFLPQIVGVSVPSLSSSVEDANIHTALLLDVRSSPWPYRPPSSARKPDHLSLPD